MKLVFHSSCRYNTKMILKTMITLNVVVFVITGDGRVEGLVPRVQRQERGGRD